MADSDLTRAITVASDLGVSPANDRLLRLIGVASAAVRSYLRRPAMHYQAGIVELVASTGNTFKLQLAVAPVLSVAAVVFNGATLDEVSIHDSGAGQLFRRAGWPYTGTVHAGLLYDWPARGSEEKAIAVTYTGGWVTPAQATASLARTLPADIEEATIQTVVALFRSGGRDRSIVSESLGNASVSYDGRNTLIGRGTGGVIPDAACVLLDAYRRADFAEV